jgi:heme exporter protein C
VNVPIIHFSVEWWSSLHQTASVMKLSKPSMPLEMVIPLLAMFLSFTLLFGALLLVRLRGEVLRRERSAKWIQEAVGP